MQSRPIGPLRKGADRAGRWAVSLAIASPALLTGLYLSGFEGPDSGFLLHVAEWTATVGLGAAVLGLFGGRARSARALGLLLASVVAGAVWLLLPPGWLLKLANSDSTPLFFETNERIVALSIDDSLDPVGTPRLLEVLKRHQVRATFFVLSESVRGNEALMQQLVNEGHEIGNHQTQDVRGWRMSDREFADDIDQAGDTLKPYGPVHWLRPGGGITTGAMRNEAERQGYRVVLGSVFPFDSHLPSTSFMFQYVNQRVFPGSIIVLHDGPERGARSARALDAVLPMLRQAGYQMVTVTELSELKSGN